MESVPLSLGLPRPERGDAARNRRHLLDVARQMVAESGAEKVTMDGLAERAGLGKGTVFRRFRTRAGIFHALLDEDEAAFQQSVLSGPPPLGPGAGPVTRLIAFGHARIEFLFTHAAIARASLDTNQPTPVSVGIAQSQIRMLLGRADIGVRDLETLAIQLTAALEGPILLYLRAPAEDDAELIRRSLADGWQTLIERLCGAPR
ncbi:helix-turn-helix domain-containing protein [Nocardia sp. NPDC023852]|uniref:TetR/AcrR family transcriptional regulator n=1 Tax=Nocardia sp. NPDC023852 TaxID=3154697 RepID=UPI0033E5C696